MTGKRNVVVVDDQLHERQRRAEDLQGAQEAGEVVALSFEAAFEHDFSDVQILVVDGHDSRPGKAREQLRAGPLQGLDDRYVGVQLVGHVRSQWPDIQIILITTFSRDGTLALLIQAAGCDYRFDKSVLATPQALRDAVFAPREHRQIAAPEADLQAYYESIACSAWRILDRRDLSQDERRRWAPYPYLRALEEELGIRRTGKADPVLLRQVLSALEGEDRLVLEAIMRNATTRELTRLKLERQARPKRHDKNARMTGFTQLGGGADAPELPRRVLGVVLRALLGHRPDDRRDP